MKLNRVSAAVAASAIAGVAVLSGFCLAPHHPGTAAHPVTAVSRSASAARLPHDSSHRASTHAAAAAAPAAPAAPADPAMAWLESAGGQAQVTFNNQVATLAADLWVENGSPTVASHLLFEAAARAVRAQARTILTTPALLPAVNRAAYQRMLNDFIVVANLLQPGPGYGTTPQDYAAWNTAMNASNITVS
jgi:hypothetical protein